MEKEIKIIPPEGFEIDKKNSTFECIKFKPIKKDLTYEDVCKGIFTVPYYYINKYGIIKNYGLDHGICCQDCSISENQLKKVLAINQLMNIAKYYNEDWEPDWNDSDSEKFYINYYKGRYEIDSLYTTNCGGVYFKNMEDAQAVIDNPNLQDILDTIFK